MAAEHGAVECVQILLSNPITDVVKKVIAHTTFHALHFSQHHATLTTHYTSHTTHHTPHTTHHSNSSSQDMLGNSAMDLAVKWVNFAVLDTFMKSQFAQAAADSLSANNKDVLKRKLYVMIMMGDDRSYGLMMMSESVDDHVMYDQMQCDSVLCIGLIGQTLIILR